MGYARTAVFRDYDHTEETIMNNQNQKNSQNRTQNQNQNSSQNRTQNSNQNSSQNRTQNQNCR